MVPAFRVGGPRKTLHEPFTVSEEGEEAEAQVSLFDQIKSIDLPSVRVGNIELPSRALSAR